MAEQLSALKARFGEAREAVVAGARQHAFWLALPAVVLVVVATAALTGRSALLRADAWEARVRELNATKEAAAVWREELEPASPGERSAWRASAAAVRERAIDPSDRLALLQEVAQRAEDLGIGSAEVAFASADTLDTYAIREVGEEVFEMASWALSVRFEADYRTTASFIGALPPQVDVHRLRMTALEGAVGTDLLLIVYARGAE